MSQTPLAQYYQKIDAGDLQPDTEQARVAEKLDALYYIILHNPSRGKGGFIKRLFGSVQDIRGLYLWGGVGRGKSMLMDMFYDSVPDEIPKRRVHFHEFMVAVHDYMHEARQNGDAGKALLKYAAQIAKEARLLCFDEFHVTDIADAMILGRLFTALFQEGVVVVATSNWPPDNLYEGGLQRDLFLPFIALLKERLEALEINGDVDYRLQCLSNTGVYFTPLGHGARQQAGEVFTRLTDGAHPYDEILTVKGRDIHVEIVAKGVARFTFAQLCEQPHGAEDYLTVAKTYHTVFLEGVPKLGYDRRNEAKRLMTLVDALYEQGTKLVVTADALPDKLYQGRDHGFEFQRTVSRLMEMQGDDYLSMKRSAE